MKRNYLKIFTIAFVYCLLIAAYILIFIWQSKIDNGSIMSTDEKNSLPTSHSHTFSQAATTPPTCATQGYTTYTCSCGETYIAEYIPTLSHEFVDSCCVNCGCLSAEIEYIELHSAEDLYALSRIFASEQAKAYIYDQNYTIEQDLGIFEYPAGVSDLSSRIQYLATAAYKLTTDVSLCMQHTASKIHFLGIGSSQYPFMGIFNGNGQTITLTSTDTLKLANDSSHQLGLFGSVQNAKIANVNISVMDDISVSSCKNVVMYGILAGYASESQISNCSVAVSNATVGVCFKAGETDTNKVHLGGLVGECNLSIIRNSTVTLTDSTLLAEGYDVSKYESMYAFFSVGGILGFSLPGSDNIDHIGRVGTQLVNCNFISHNKEQRNVILASIEKGDEITTGGLVGCTFNNFVAKDCSVDISKGNIIAQKTGQTDIGTFGTNAGGIIGRLEHTGELFNCNVNGNDLNIISKSPENYSTVGGICGYDMGPYHKDVISLNHCSINGNGTSKIILEITADASINKWNALGGIAGCSSYLISDCAVYDITLENTSENVDKIYVGGICGIMNSSSFWSSKTYFTPSQISGLANCSVFGLKWSVARNAKVNGTIALKYN